jgi:hypothetical protein
MTWNEMKRARRALADVRNELGDKFGPDEAKHDVRDALDSATSKTSIGALGAAYHVKSAFAAVSRPDYNGGFRREEPGQVALAHDIFGNPFRPVAFDPSWRTDTAVSLARRMYESREFSALPILADALQDAGCEDADILGHCRDPRQPHVRGCWAVDLVLGTA